MKPIYRAVLLVVLITPFPSIMAQVGIKNNGKDLLNAPKDSLIHLIRKQDSILNLKRQDSARMANMIATLEMNRDSLNSSLNQAIYKQKLDSADQMRRYLGSRDSNRRLRSAYYDPIGLIDDDSVRSSMKEVIDVVYEDTAFHPRPLILQSSFDRLFNHLTNDSVYLNIINTKQDTVPFVLKTDKIDSTAFFLLNSSNDSAKVYVRGVGKNTLYMWVGDDLMLRHLFKKQTTPGIVDINWQDPNKLRVARRPVPVEPVKPWYLKSEFNFLINQNAMLNWALGGNNNSSLTTEVKSTANYSKGSFKWDNFFWFVYGLQKSELQPVRKSNDRINLISNISHKAFKNFDYTLSNTFLTQGFKGYAYPNDSVPVSKFMAPATWTISAGMTYRPNPKLRVYLSPIGGKFTFVLDTVMVNPTRWGLKKGERMNAQIGPTLEIEHTTVVAKKVNMTNKLVLFSNYIEEPEKINFDWILAMNLKVNKYMSLSVQTETKYDNRVLIPIYEIQDGKKVKVGDGKRVQFNEMLGLKFTYYLY